MWTLQAAVRSTLRDSSVSVDAAGHCGNDHLPFADAANASEQDSAGIIYTEYLEYTPSLWKFSLAVDPLEMKSIFAQNWLGNIKHVSPKAENYAIGKLSMLHTRAILRGDGRIYLLLGLPTDDTQFCCCSAFKFANNA
jgi:hypothetical protein